MIFRRDSQKGADFQPGLPRAQAGEDVPRWLVALGLAAGFTLLIALLRYAIDLLGVVLVIILVGFAIRTVSDWLTEGETVSGWAMSALSMSLTGTVLVGLWLFNSRGTDGIEARLPGPVQRSVGWFERRGWGQRVLLPAASPSSSAMGRNVGSAPARGEASAAGASAPAGPDVRMAPSLPVTPPRPPADARRRTPPRRDTSEAEAAPSPRSPSAGGTASGAEPATAAPPAAVVTAVTLSVSPARAVVGTSVRMTATVTPADTTSSPRGSVAFYRGAEVLGRVPVRRIEGAWRAMLVTLDLEIGDHALHAAYEGDDRHAPSRSAVVQQLVVRK
jgi:Bacterial Ig-like domain (group 3)